LSHKLLKQVLRLSCVWFWLIPSFAYADDARLRVEVTAPYIEMHTGPGSSYPIHQVVERGEWIEIIKRRTDWIKVSTHRDRTGWVHVTQMRMTRTAEGVPLDVKHFGFDDFTQRDWEFGFLGGDMEGASLLGLYGGYSFNENLSAEVSFSEAIGTYSSLYMADVNLLSHPFPEWRYSPFFTVGGGMINTQPNATLVQTKDRTDTTAHVGVGLHAYVSRRFFLRAEFRHYTVFTSREDNEDFDQWKIGFGFFF
jgi:hypothetical protein